ncbi:MAG: HAMP domain-containing sensor histidine kinase [Cyclobacteriaceae bacterium]
MSIQKIRWIIGLMSFALLGLICFQFYWIDSVLKANEERFKSDVREALRIVTLKLEKQEVLDVTFDNLKTTFQWQRTNNGKEIELIESTFEKRILNVADVDSVTDVGDHRVLFSITDGPDGSVPHIDQENAVVALKKEGDDAPTNIYLKKRFDSVDFASIKLQKELEKVVNKSEMVQVVIHELLTNDRTIDNRINAKTLDSLLQMELQSKGIRLNFDFAVFDPIEPRLILSSVEKPEPPPLLMETELRASLFPNDILGENSLLLIHFPNQQQYLFRKIWLTLSSSVFLIFVIIFCFGYAIHTILKQKKLSEIKNDFINNMTHEFKTPISTVSLACEALQDKEVNASPGLTERYVGIISDENKRLGQQVEKVLQMAVIERKDFKLKPEPLDIHGIINKAIENIKIQVEKRHGSILFEGKALHTELQADEMHLTNIIYNLLDNANKYSSDKPRITVSTIDNTEGIKIAVADQGIGMSRDQQSRIFERFYRVPTGNIHDVKGFGLGLAYVRRIVNAHGGDITVKSKLNEGSTFEIFLPFEQQDEGH